MAGLKVNTYPANEPIATATAKTFLRVDGSSEDTLIDSLIKSARMFCEEYTGRTLINTTYDFYMDGFSEIDTRLWEGTRVGPDITLRKRYIELPRPPLSTVTSIYTFDDSDNETVFSSSKYYVDNVSEPAKIVLREGESWPTSLRVANAVRIRYVAGYGSQSSDVPDALITGMKEHISFMYENRGDSDIQSMPLIAKQLYQPYRILKFSTNPFANNNLGSQIY